MRVALAAWGASALVGAALAAPGDPVSIERGTVIRVAPRPDAPVLKEVDEARPAVERGRREGWLEVEIPDLLVRGWLPALEPNPESTVSNRVPKLKPQVLESPAPEPAAEGGRLARLLEPPPPMLGAEAPKPRGEAEGEPVARFRESVRYFEAKRATGPRVLGRVEGRGEGVVLITATNGWGALAENERQAWLAALFDRWLAASRSLGALRLEIRTRDGDVVMSRTGP